MEKSFEIQKVQMESSVVGQKRNSPSKEFTPKTRKTLTPQLLVEVSLTPHSDQVIVKCATLRSCPRLP